MEIYIAVKPVPSYGSFSRLTVQSTVNMHAESIRK